MDSDTNLDGMRPNDAKEYILAHMTDLIRMRKEIEGLEAEIRKWETRVALAAGKGLEDLRSGAELQAGEFKRKLESLRSEETELSNSIRRMREQLPGLAAKVRSVDTDLLLAELQVTLDQFEPFRDAPSPQPTESMQGGSPASMTGPEHSQANGTPPGGERSSLEKRMKEEMAESELTALKDKLKG
jgi:hypothetical protein